MKYIYFSIVFVLTLMQNTTAQVLYDTIPPDYYDKPYIYQYSIYFPDMGKQLSNNIKYSDNCEYNGRVIVSTTFGKDGHIKKNRIILSSNNPEIDSIVYYATIKLHDWLPAMENGRFFDERVIYPVIFKYEDGIQRVFFPDSLNFNPKLIQKRKELFSFYNSDENIMIDIDYYFFKGLTAEYLSKSIEEVYHISKGYPTLRKKERYTFNIENNIQDAKFIIIENRKDRNADIIADEIDIKKDQIYLIRNRIYTLIGYSETEKKICMLNVKTDEDKSLFLDFKTYTKKEYYDELKRLVENQIASL